MSEKLFPVLMSKTELWAALSAIEGIREAERTAHDKSALRKLWAVYDKALVA